MHESAEREGQKAVAQATRKYEVVNVIPGTLDICAPGRGTEGILPAGLRKVERLVPVDIPAAAHNHEFFLPLLQATDGQRKFIGKHDVRIDVTDQWSGCVLLRPAKKVINHGRIEFVSGYFREMTNPQAAGDFRRSVFHSEEEDFRPGIEARPAGDGIALNLGKV